MHLVCMRGVHSGGVVDAMWRCVAAGARVLALPKRAFR